MKPTGDDFEPRRDGWFEHQGTWQEVTVGTVIGTRKRSEAWEIIEQSHGLQVEYGHTLWMRAREITSGAEFTVDPRLKTARVTILTKDPRDTQTPALTWPSDSDTIALLVKELGATHLATRDDKTGEITCPYYAAGHNHIDSNTELLRGEIEHLRFAHAMKVPDDARREDVHDAHAKAHDPAYVRIGKGGFPHRHVPEDLSYL